MITTAIIVILSLLSLIYMARLAKGHAAPVRAPEDLRASVRRLDLQAFRNLTDPSEDEYLQQTLSQSEYKKVRRDRLRAALAYVSCAAGNAAVLVRLGEAARQSADPAVVEAGDKLVNSAIRLRLFAFQAALMLRINLALPAGRITSGSLADRYELIARQGVLLGRMQYQNGSISSVL